MDSMYARDGPFKEPRVSSSRAVRISLLRIGPGMIHPLAFDRVLCKTVCRWAYIQCPNVFRSYPMSRLRCPGCGQERGVDIECGKCGSRYCSESCVRWHYWRKHWDGPLAYGIMALFLIGVFAFLIYRSIVTYPY
jgi:hypothetical protein